MKNPVKAQLARQRHKEGQKEKTGSWTAGRLAVVAKSAAALNLEAR
jgi:hypothetical protein